MKSRHAFSRHATEQVAGQVTGQVASRTTPPVTGEVAGQVEAQEAQAQAQANEVLATFRDRVCAEMFPSRTDLPKSLIFVKDDAHADDIVRLCREVFGKGNDFCEKITYKTTGEAPKALIAAFRNCAVCQF